MLKYLFFVVLFFCISCTAQPVKINRESSIERNKELLRADPIYLNWLEKQSLLRQAPDKIRIVSGSNLAWNNLSVVTSKNEFLKLTPSWFFANPLNFEKGKSQTHLGRFLQNNSVKSLLDIGINSVFITPLARHSFNTDIGFDSKVIDDNKTQAAISYDLSEEIATVTEYYNLQNRMIIGSEMLKPSLGLGADFILALHAVREYPGLFMMAELPKEFWDKFPVTRKEYVNIYSPYVLNEEDKNFLIAQKLLPVTFARDFISKDSSFALSPPIRGLDSLERRWVYRFVNDPNTAILNFSDPSLTAQKLFSASIIQQVGLLHQALIGVNISDLWGQEVVNNLDENLKIDPYDLKLAEPALTALTSFNKSIHSYGAWSIITEAFPIDFLPLLSYAKTDFMADTVIMPELEKSLFQEDTTMLKQNVQKALDLKVDFSALWRGSPDTYQNKFLGKYFTSFSSMSLAAKIAKISHGEASIIQKMLTYPKELQSDKQLLAKYNKAKSIQYSYLKFQNLLPGLSFISGYDLRGIVSENNNLPSYSLNEFVNSNFEQKISWHQSLSQQSKDENSLIAKLKKVYEFKQKFGFASAQVLAVLDTSPQVFGLITKNLDEKYFLIMINVSSKNMRSQIDIPLNNKFMHARELFTSQYTYLNKNSAKVDFNPWQVKCFELR